MGLFDNDPKYQELKTIRESGYDGPINQDGQKVATGRAAEIFAALRER
ncbi:hypothetical protein [Streptosporangium longisporum]|uniref:Uncharacterized protein n=1 Tax=Streptosporangium longisporum TaxID=46187 RepID=A0ABP6LGJ3_9ACTN